MILSISPWSICNLPAKLLKSTLQWRHFPVARLWYRFEELPRPVLETLTVVVKGVRNIPGIAYQRTEDQYIKYIGNVGQDLVESIYSFTGYNPIPASQLIQSAMSPPSESGSGREELVNLGWRG